MIYGESIEPEDLNLPDSIHRHSVKETREENGQQEDDVISMEEMEKRHIAKVLKINRWDRTQTASFCYTR